MAHQAHNIPWEALASSFNLVKVGPRGTPDRHTVFEPIRGEAAEKKRQHFVHVFLRTLEEFSDSERRKYPENIAVVEDNDNDDDDVEIFDDGTIRTVNAYVEAADSDTKNVNLSRYRCRRGWKHDFCSVSDERSGVVMALLATNEIAPLFRLAKMKNEPLKRVWRYMGADPGWNNVLFTALMPYLFLNVVYVRSELWMPEGSDGGGKDFQRDYRDMDGFRRMLQGCTESREQDTWTIPHREFFGRDFSYGETGAKLKEEGVDPLAPGNGERLREYLKLCWSLLVRVHMVGKEAGMDIEWSHYVKREVSWLLGYEAFSDTWG